MTTDYRAQVERAIRYIVAHRSEPLPLRDVARAAHLSEFHFHRIFSGVMGETVGRFITRHRLETAALALAYESKSITEVALDAGYSSLSNFSKAFSAWFGVSPSAVRARLPAATDGIAKVTRGKVGELHPLPPEPSSEERARLLTELGPVRFVERAAMPVACLASPAGYDFTTLEATWDAMIRSVLELGISDEAVDAYGMAYDSPQLTAPELCRYHACVPCPANHPLPLPLFHGVIPEGRYAVFSYSGPTGEVERAYRTIYSLWFPSTKLAPDDYVAFEHYLNDAPIEGHITYDIYIKVRPRT